MGIKSTQPKLPSKDFLEKRKNEAGSRSWQHNQLGNYTQSPTLLAKGDAKNARDSTI